MNKRKRDNQSNKIFLGVVSGIFGFNGANSTAQVYWDSVQGLKNISGQFVYNNPNSQVIDFAIGFVENQLLDCSNATQTALFTGKGLLDFTANSYPLHISTATFRYSECSGHPTWTVSAEAPSWQYGTVALSDVDLELTGSASGGIWTFSGIVEGVLPLWNAESTLVVEYSDASGLQNPMILFR